MVSSCRNNGTISQELRYPFTGTVVQFWQESSDGELKPAIEEKVSELKLEKSVELLGRLNSNQMLEQYIISDCFVFLN